MHQFKISITPVPAKRLELHQTLETLMVFFRPYCNELILSESKRTLSLSGSVNDMGHLQKMTESREFDILTGALTMLASKTDFNIKGMKDVVQFDQMQKVFTQLGKSSKTT